ncbi:MAG TPA: alcohol dehydrogenase catalytic domain-containing protein [Planktothrix sp.]|jgi:L-iditol 2-dehydrogenase
MINAPVSLAAAAAMAASTQTRHFPQPRMKALVREGGRVSVQLMQKPPLTDSRSVLIRVTLAGLCRTDLYAAEGRMKTCDPLVLGHEFSGIIEEVGAEVDGLRAGNRVTVNPLLPCETCRHCVAGFSGACQNSTFLGVDRTGCFAHFICVPARAVFRLADNVSDLAAAYAEPVAASLAVLKAGINTSDKVLIYGKNRFSQLLEKILQIHGIRHVTTHDTTTCTAVAEAGTFDCVVETMLNAKAFSEIVDAVRPGGKIVLKSRQFEPVPLLLTDLLKKEPIMHVVNYGPFDHALRLLTGGKLHVEDLVDGVYRLEQYEQVMKTARNRESLKPFFAPWE